MKNWLRRLWRRRPAPSGGERWAHFLTDEQLQQFEGLVVECARELGHAVEIRDGTFDLQGMRCGLDNLAQLCRKMPPEEWRLAITDHLETLLATFEQRDQWDGKQHDWEHAQSMLALRLHPRSLAEQSARLLTREDLPETVTVLSVDLPTHVATLDPEVAKGWGVETSELFERALQNLVADWPVEYEQTSVGDTGVTLHVLHAPHVYVTTHVLRLDAFRGLVGEHGTLVAVPNRHHIVAWPIDGRQVRDAIAALLAVETRMYSEGPGSLSPHVYWRRRDGFFAVQTSLSAEGRLTLAPDLEFAMLLE